MRAQHRRYMSLVALVALTAGCSEGVTGETAAAGASDGATSTTTESAPVETDSASPRLALTYDGGLLVVDAQTLETVADLPEDGFLRVGPAGDDRRVIVSGPAGFRVLDTASWSERHDDHEHHYAGDPVWADTTIPADKPGHAVPHEGRLALFDDATGLVRMLRTETLGDLDNGNRGYDLTLPTPHHGVAVPLASGDVLTSLGTEDERTGATVVDSTGAERLRNEQCPGVHGEATAAGGVVVVGCQDGVLIYRDGTFTKVDAPDDYGRIGNQSGSDSSPVVLGDYKTDPDAELERPERVSLINTDTGDLRIVDIGTSYTFRSLGRGRRVKPWCWGPTGRSWWSIRTPAVSSDVSR